MLLVLAADHLIHDQAAFAAAVARAEALARDRRAGHLRHHADGTRDRLRLHRVRRGVGDANAAVPAFAALRFVEKPPLDRAKAYVEAGTFVWNSGMFCFTARAMLAAFAQHAPAVLAAARAALPAGAARGEAMLEIDATAFAAAPDVSIDYAVMEPAAAAGAVAVVRGAFDWSDIGSWQAVADLRPWTPTATAARASACSSAPATPTCTPRVAWWRRSASTTSSSSTPPTPCWSPTATTCSG